jgi:putative tricarboxylic transport membrane protein
MIRPSEAALGVGLVILALVIIQIATQITVGFSYDNVGPRTFPYIIAAMLGLSGVAVTTGAFFGEPEGEQNEERIQWLPIALISAALIFQMFVVRQIGWIPAATISFAVVAFAFGERRMVLNLLFGSLLAFGTYFLFNYGLQLRLPAGYFLEGVL